MTLFEEAIAEKYKFPNFSLIDNLFSSCEAIPSGGLLYQSGKITDYGHKVSDVFSRSGFILELPEEKDLPERLIAQGHGEKAYLFLMDAIVDGELEYYETFLQYMTDEKRISVMLPNDFYKIFQDQKNLPGDILDTKVAYAHEMMHDKQNYEGNAIDYWSPVEIEAYAMEAAAFMTLVKDIQQEAFDLPESLKTYAKKYYGRKGTDTSAAHMLKYAKNAEKRPKKWQQYSTTAKKILEVNNGHNINS